VSSESKDQNDNRESSRIGRWMGTLYTGAGDRTDCVLDLEENGRFIECSGGRTIEGKWSESVSQLHLAPDEPNARMMDYRILKIESLERAENFMVLRWAGLASRNLPILFYRVHRPA